MDGESSDMIDLTMTTDWWWKQRQVDWLDYDSSVDDMFDEQMMSNSACDEQIDMMCMYSSKKGWLYDAGSNLMNDVFIVIVRMMCL